MELPRMLSRPGEFPLRHNGFFLPDVCAFGAEGIACAQNGRIEANNVYGREVVNKAELIDALAVRLGDKKSAASALDAVLAEIQSAVTKGDKVAITGFGVFEKRVRAARTARNPRTGESVKVKKTSVPAFRAGASFKDQVASGKVPRATAAKKTAAPAKKAATKATATRATATKTATKAPAKTAAAKKTAAKTTRAASTTARKTATAPAKTTAAKKAPARKAR
jgi:DNA-binding protein HU-beta